MAPGSAPKLLVIGLDCMEPSLVFERWRDDLPTLSRLMAAGSYGRLESSIPAITVPAWSCMMSGRDPGELGIYGFRNRQSRDYHSMTISDGRAVKEPRLWDLLGDAGWQVAVLSVPGTSPPYPVHGSLLSCFLTPSPAVPHTYPPELGDRIQGWIPDLLLDVAQFRSDDKAAILANIYTLCDQRFTLAERFIQDDHPDFLMLVDMGVDRIHHSFWKPMDPTHPQHDPHSPYGNAIHDYYVHLDQRIAQLLHHCDDHTAVLVVSDHGARSLLGGICINQWLIDQGYLVIKESPTVPTSLEDLTIDWEQTQAWGAGGYYARIFINVKGREPQGIVPLADYERLRTELAERIGAIAAPDGTPMDNWVYKPQAIYQRVRGIAPDLLAYFDELAWRSIGTVGHGGLYTTDNDTGPDDANHARYGLMIFHDPQRPRGGQVLHDAQIYDILPTLLHRYQLPIPPKLRGKILPV
jgi:predicted AlkP superfamily phosphohydrolase/phosphomutase